MQTPSNRWGPLPPHDTGNSRVWWWRWLEGLLLLIAAVCIGYYAYVTVEAYAYQAYETRELDAILHSAPAREADQPRSAARRRVEPTPGSTIGRIDIPRLGVSAIVRAGSDAKTLRLAVGHIPGTALPGEAGNVGLAGHRDTFFRQLQNIRPDDRIRITSIDGTYTYQVERTTIVNPSDVWVLDPTEHGALTLVTCYPFSYVGSAPQRFVVRARLVPAAQSAVSSGEQRQARDAQRARYNSEAGPRLRTVQPHDHRGVQSQRRSGQDHDGSERRNRARRFGQVRPAGRSRGGLEFVDFARSASR
jgi:sortase A